MAAVYSEKESGLQSTNESSSTEYEKAAVQEVSIDLVRNIKTFNAKNTIEEMELGLSGPILKAQDHAEVVATSAAFPAVKIKIEEVDEDECVSVYLDDAKEGLDGRTTKKEDLTEREKIADVTDHSQMESVINKTESGLSFGKQMKVKEEKEQDNIESFDSSCQVKPSEIPTIQPCVIVQSAEEKSLYRTNRIYVCPICGKVYSYLESFRNHQKLHITSKAQLSEFSCQKCKKMFSGPASLAIHIKFNKRCFSKEHTNHRCDQCNKSFSSVVKFEAHQEMHKLRPHRCTLCAKCFVSSEGLKRHLLGHNYKKYKCDICQKSFRVPAELRYHYNIHTGAKPYTCNLCDKAFAQLGNLITHRKKHLTVFKEGDDVPLGRNDTDFIGQNQVLVVKKVVSQEKGLDNKSSSLEGDKTNFSPEILEVRPSGEALEDWECFECRAHFREEAELHMHYMKHARGEI